MRNSKVERKAIAELQKIIDEYTSNFEPSLTQGDKEPIWDGKIIKYKGNKLKVSDFEGNIPCQVKGLTTNDLEKSNINYSVRKSDLEAFLKDGGAMFFVGYVSKDITKCKMYYNDLLPVKIKKVLNKCNSKTVSISFKEILNQEISTILDNFVNDRKRQFSFSDQKMPKLEEMIWNKNIRVFGSLVIPSVDPEDIVRYVRNNGMYTYCANLNETYENVIPFEDGIIDVIEFFEKIESSITIEDKTFYKSYVRKIKHDVTEIALGECITFIFKRSNIIKGKIEKIDFSFKLTKSLSHVIRDMQFYREFLEYGYFSIDANNINIPFVNDVNFENEIKRLDSDLKKYEDLQKMFNILNIEAIIDLEKLTRKEEIFLQMLVRYFLYNELDSIIVENVSLFKERIQDIGFFFASKKDGEKGYILQDYFSIINSPKAVSLETNEVLGFSKYINFKSEDFGCYCGIDYDDMIETYNENKRLGYKACSLANENLLELLRAYDNNSPNKSILLEVVEKVANWIIENLDDDYPSDIAYINLMQIYLRSRELTEIEKFNLRKLLDNSTELENKTAINILLNQIESAEYYLSLMNPDRKQVFLEYPISKFLKKN